MLTRVACRPCSPTDSPKQAPEDSGGRLTLGGRIIFSICILIIVINVIIVIIVIIDIIVIIVVIVISIYPIYKRRPFPPSYK